jgi:uncharacterized protein (TIGR03067 family)
MKALAACMCALSVLSLALAGEGPEKQVKDDLAKLEGTWELVSYEIAGEKLAPENVQQLPKITFKGRDYSWSDGETGTITDIDPSKKPKTIEYKFTSGDLKNTIQLAIYEIDGDTFKDCIAPPGAAAYPKDFSTNADNGQTLITYRRMKDKGRL